MVERFLVKYHHIFPRHWLDVGINNEFKIKLVLLHDEPAYSQSLPTQTNLKDQMLVESTLQPECGIITTVPFSKYSCPTFAQSKLNKKLGILVNLRQTNHLIKQNYNEHNHPVTTIAVAEKHLAGKKCF